ncbi:MAG TPA: hypothetical protein PKA64_12125 [Myxococcota bacterium]|nr:hypothetical protein [Myxococcota bacterium]
MPTSSLPTFNLNTLERLAIEQACAASASLVEAAKLVGLTRHALKRRLIKHNIRPKWPLPHNAPKSAPAVAG